MGPWKVNLDEFSLFHDCWNSQLEVGPALNPVIYSAQTAPKDTQGHHWIHLDLVVRKR